MIPAVLDALRRDGGLRGQDQAVYAACLERLDFHHFRSLKQVRLTLPVRKSKGPEVGTPADTAHIRRSLRRLAHLGYLDRGPLEHGLRTYRLVYGRAERSPLAPKLVG